MSTPRTIVITGSLRGLGYQLSKILIKENKFQVILTSRDASSAQKVVDELKAINTSCVVGYHQLQIDSQQSRVEFVDWLKQSYGTIDVLVNNAAIKEAQVKDLNVGDAAALVLLTNVTSTINLTEAILPILSHDGKILMVSSYLGSLCHQGEQIQKELSDPQITIEIINQKINELVQMKRDGNVQGWQDSTNNNSIVYSGSKTLLNAYTRFILAKNLPSPQQTVIALHPGWCQTDMGGAAAPLTAEEGTVAMLRAINDFGFGESAKYNGIFLDQNGESMAY